ncbi:GAF domain-containing protein [Gymnodinialimonas sp.]
MTDPDRAQAQFEGDLARATSEEDVFAALYRFSNALMPVRLWTVMTVDLNAGVARRAFSNMPDAYPTSGTKEITPNAWFDIVHGRRECFVANSLDDIAAVFPDYELIGALGCASVMNLPVFDDGELLATVNLLDREGYFSADRVAACREILTEPALTALRAARAKGHSPS